VEQHVSQAKKHAESARDRRNHRIAHRDRWQPERPVRYGDLKAGLDSVYAALNVVEMGFWNTHLVNDEVSNEMRTAQFVGRLESLVEAVLFIESKIDPTVESRSFDHDVAIAFLAKIEGTRTKTWEPSGTSEGPQGSLESDSSQVSPKEGGRVEPGEVRREAEPEREIAGFPPI